MNKTTKNQDKKVKKPIKGFSEIQQVAQSEPEPCEKFTATISMGNANKLNFEVLKINEEK